MTPRGHGRSGGDSRWRIFAPGSSGRRLGRLAAAVGTLSVLAVTLSACDYTDVLGLGWPKGITPEAETNYKFWVAVVIASLVVGVLVWGMIFWSCTFHRKKATDTELPRQFGYNMPLELALTVIPFLIIAVLFYFTVVVQEKMLNSNKDPEVVVDITAFQWNWKFGYQQVDFADGTYHYDGAQPERQQAMSSKPEGKDAHGEELVGPLHGLNKEDRSYLHFDKVETLGTTDEIPVLVLPKGKRIEFQMASADVVHAFWVPEFLFKRDVMPDPKANHTVNVFQVSEIDRLGSFVGRCAEMCGTYHSMMNFEVRVVEPNDFKAYLDKRREGKTNAEALEAIHNCPVAETTHPFDARRGLQSPQTPKAPQRIAEVCNK